jgi:DNA gyrase/topoisomerase IV subunit A
MNLIITILLVSVFLIAIYFFANRFTKKNQDFSQSPTRINTLLDFIPKIEEEPLDLELTDLEPMISDYQEVLASEVKVEKEIRKEKKKYYRPKAKKTSSSSSIGVDELTKAKKPSNKKPKVKKREGKKDKGDDLLLS